MIADTATRVARSTPERLNDRIRERTVASLEHYALAGKEDIRRRLQELDEEWDIERVLITQASSLALGSLILGKVWHRGAYVFTGLVCAFLLRHGLEGWCPPIRPLRSLGVRTPREIEDERHALLELLAEKETLS